MNRRILAVLVAVILAVVGAGLVIVYAQNADKRAIAEAQPTKVYMAAKLIPSGTTLKDAERTELFYETNVAAKAVPQGALENVDSTNNALLALSDIRPGEILMDARFGTTPIGTKAIEVPAGMLAISVELKDPARVGTFVTPGSHIAIYETHKEVSLEDSDRAEKINSQNFKGTNLLLDDLLVIAMGQTALAAPQRSEETEEGDPTLADTPTSPSFLVTVAVKPEDAPTLVHGIQARELYAALRGSDVKLDPRIGASDLGRTLQDKP